MNTNFSSENSIILPVSLDRLREIVRESVRSEFLQQEKGKQGQESKSLSEEYMTRDEAARLLRVSTVTLRKYVKKGRIKAYNFGRRVLYRRSEVEQAVEAPFQNRDHRRSHAFQL